MPGSGTPSERSSSTDSAAQERLLEWASTVGGGTIDSFRDAHAWCTSNLERKAGTQALLALERLCHVDIDWDRRQWSITPTAIAMIDGAGGNGLLVGARTRETHKTLAELVARQIVAGVTRRPQPRPAPDAIFIGVPVDEARDRTAAELHATVVTDPRLPYHEMLLSLDELLATALSEFTASGFQASQLNAVSMAFEPVDIRGGHWHPGCFEQQSRGVRRYLFVDDDGRLHNTGRQVAIYAELRRRRLRGEPVHAGGVPIAWDPDSERLVCSARAPLPLIHERVAILGSGFLPRMRSVELHGSLLNAFIYEGVPATTFGRIARSLDCPVTTVSVPIEEWP